jgi:ligand-binding sensor domain-containing protein/signal transduction histidine kinase
MFCPSSQAQQYSFVNYNIRDGLAGSVVYRMAQDHDGFIWFATETGLSRFDGTRFKNFTTADGLPENEIILLKVDAKNRVWVLPFGNKICYFLKGKLHTEENDSLLRRLNVLQRVTAIVENDRGEIVLAEKNKLSIIDNNDRVRFIQNPYDSVALHHLGLDFDNSFLATLIIFNRGFFVYKKVGDTLVEARNLTEYKNSPQNGLFFSSELSALYRPDSIRFRTPTENFAIPSDKGFINLSLLNDSLVAIASLSKTYTYNFRQKKEDREFFTGKNITDVLEDNEGNLWFSSAGDGVYRLPSTRFRSWTFALSGQKLPVYSLLKSKDELWIGTEQFSLYKLNTKNNGLERFALSAGETSGRITGIVSYSDHKLMLGTDLGLYYHNGKEIDNISERIPVKSMFIYNDTIIIGGNSAAYNAVRQNSIPVLKKFLFNTRTSAIFWQKGITYFGTLHGLYVKKEQDTATYAGREHAALAGRITIIGGNAEGPVWLGTSGFGVIKYENEKVTAVLNTDSGLTSNIVRTLFVDKNIIWVGTDKGLNKVEDIQGRYRITRYTTADGLISNMINALHVEDNGKTVYVGTPEGLTGFNEDSVFTNSICMLHVTSIHSARQRTISDTVNIRFEHFDNNIRFEFTGISFKSAGEINYRYRLQGLNNEWDTTRDNFLLYPTLPSGDYVLQLQAVNKFNVESEVISIPFSIELLLWEKNWFRVLAIIFVGALIWIAVAWRIRRVRRQEQLKTDTARRIADLEQMALRAQMNPHFIFNSLNSIQHYVFGKDIQGANRFITEFSRLIRMTMEMSGKNRISLEDEIRFLSTYLELEKKRFENKFVYEVNVAPGVDPPVCYIPPMMLQPYVENAIRHGIRYLDENNGLILLNFAIEGEYLVCAVEDNGIGREKSQQLKGNTVIEYQSQGMTLTARRIEMINRNFNNPIMIVISDIYRENEVAGTKVIIRIPLHEISKP